MSGVTELPPNVELFNTINFNSAFFTNANTGYLTFSEATSLFVQYPTAQGKETLQNTTVNGNLTVADNVIVNGDYIQYPDGTQQTTAMVSLSPNTTYTYATVQTNTEGAISSLSSGSPPVNNSLPYAWIYQPSANGSYVNGELFFSNQSLYQQYDYIIANISFIISAGANINNNQITTYNYTGRATCQMQIFPWYFAGGVGDNSAGINYVFSNQYLGLSYTYNQYLQEPAPNGSGISIDSSLIMYCQNKGNLTFKVLGMNGQGFPVQSTLSIEILSNSQPGCTISGTGGTDNAYWWTGGNL